MQKNWYIIYTKQKKEKKVARALSKRKIESFVPLTSQTTVVLRKKRIYQEPLFKCYLFACVSETEISKITSVAGVINLLYWKNRPAIVRDDEIRLIKEFTGNYADVRIEKINVKKNNEANSINTLAYVKSGNVLSIQNRMAKVKLPSIGFSLLAQVAHNNSSPGITFFDKKLMLQ